MNNSNDWDWEEFCKVVDARGEKKCKCQWCGHKDSAKNFIHFCPAGNYYCSANCRDRWLLEFARDNKK